MSRRMGARFQRKVDELRSTMGRKYLATAVPTLWRKHRADDPERIAVVRAASTNRNETACKLSADLSDLALR